jgi:hypothetical protein
MGFGLIVVALAQKALATTATFLASTIKIGFQPKNNSPQRKFA